MHSSDPLKKPTYTYGSKEGSDISVMLNSRTVVEKTGFVSTGELTYTAGEIIEVEIPQYDVFQLGDPVRVMVYSAGGIYVFESTVLAKEQGALIIINPPENRRRFLDKRQHPRVPVQQSGRLIGIVEAGKKAMRRFDDPLSVQLENISMAGAGLLMNVDLPLPVRTELELELDLGFTLQCRTEIIHIAKSETGIIYGTRLLHVPGDLSGKLRAFILKSQIERYYQEKEERRRKEMDEQRAKFFAGGEHKEEAAPPESPKNGGEKNGNGFYIAGEDK